MSDRASVAIFIEPSSYHFECDRLFDASNPLLNRDGTLLPFTRLHEQALLRGMRVHTADQLQVPSNLANQNLYYSLGSLKGYQQYLARDNVRLTGFVLMEPPLVAPQMYAELPELTRHFQTVYVHNTEGDGYSLKNVDQSKLKKFYWPQPYDKEDTKAWETTERMNKLVVIAGHHNPRWRKPELYSERIKAIDALINDGVIDLYGRNWARWLSINSAWPTYWRYRTSLMRAFRGNCESKMDVLSQYRFSLCFENMPMKGYITEKVFDCLYAGTVPLYLGAPDIESYLPREAYLDVRQYNSYQDLWHAAQAMPHKRWQEMREAGKEFLRTKGRELYFDSMSNIFGVNGA